MKRSVKSLIGFTIGATDGEIGKVKDFYFDDRSWTIKYLVVETGSWLMQRKVLISPEALLKPDWEGGVFSANLTIEKIKNSPDIDTDKPVSRQQEIELVNYYPRTGFWAGTPWTTDLGNTASGMPAVTNIADAIKSDDDNDPHLRSTKNVTGYRINAADGNIGEVEDFLVDENNFIINYMVVDTGNWFPGKKVIISPKWIKEIIWKTSEVIVSATVEQVKNCPEYEAGKYLSDEYEANLKNYYGRFITYK